MKKIVLSILVAGILVGANAGGLQERYEENCKYFNIQPTKMTDAELKTLVPKMDAKRAKVEEEKKDKVKKEKEAKEAELQNKIESLAEQFCVENKDISAEEFKGIAIYYTSVSDKLEKLSFKERSNVAATRAGYYASANMEGNIMTQKYGALQNIIKSLEMPSGTIQLTNSWGSVFATFYDYFYSIDSKAGLFLATYQFSSLRTSVKKNGEIDFNNQLLILIPTITIEKIGDSYWIPNKIFELITTGNQTTFQKGMIHLLLFHSLINQGGDSSYAKEYFTKHGFTQNWDRVRRIVTFLEAKGL